MSYGGYNPKAPKGPSGSSQDASTSATGRKFAVMPKKLGLGGLGYSKPPPKPAAASQAPIVPESSSGTTAKRETPSPPQENHQPTQHPAKQQKLHPVHQAPMQPHWQHTYAAAPRPAATALRPVMPVMKSGPALGYAAQMQRPVMSRVGMGYGAGTSYNSNLSLDVPLRELSPEPEPMVKQEVVVNNAHNIVDDFAYYGSVQDIDIQVKNVVCAYNLPLHIDLRKYALQTANVTLERGRGVLLRQLRQPMCYTKIYSSGKMYIVGCKSEEEAMRAARGLARSVQRVMNKLGDEVRIRNYRVCNILATCKMPFGIKVEEVAMAHPAESQYEPELSVGLVWRNKEPKATLRIHTTGSVTVTGAQSEADVTTVIERIFPILLKHRCHPKAKGETAAMKRKRETTTIKRETSRYISGPRSKMSRADSAVIGGRVVFSDEEDIYDDEYLY